jgi:hypothetical protein
VHAKVVVDQVIRKLICLHILTEKLDWSAGREGKKSTGTQETSRFWDSSVGIAEGHGSPITEDDIETGIWQWYIFGTGLDQGKVYACLLQKAAGMLQLARREIKANGPCAALSQCN